MTDSKLVDSTIWIDYLILGKFKEIIESDKMPQTSALSIYEIKKKLVKIKTLSKEKIVESINFVRENSIILDLNANISEKAAEFSIVKNLGAVDAMIYATAVENDAELLTLDNDFRNLPNVKIF